MQDQILTDLGAALVNGSLTDEALLAETGTQPVLSILPDANVVKIGGQSIIDRGRAAVFPLLDEIVANLARHKLVVGAGAGARARHAYSVGLDLGMPTGVMSVLGTFISMQNARMLNYLLAKASKNQSGRRALRQVEIVRADTAPSSHLFTKNLCKTYV